VLATILREFAGAEPQAQGPEAAAGIDRRQLPVITDQHHLGPSPLGMPEEADQLAAAQHGGLIHHQHRPVIQLLAGAVKLAQEPVAGGHLLEPLPLQAHSRDPGRGRCEQPVAVQLPSMPSDAQGEGLTRPRPPHHHGDTVAPWHRSRTIAC
jgi:hypothetical protein